MNNRLANVDNRFQNIKEHKRVLCVCSAGLLRSPTAAFVLAMDHGFNTRAAGVDAEYALIPVDHALMLWADEIVCMESSHKQQIDRMKDKWELNTPVINLEIGDVFNFRDPLLMQLIRERYKLATSD